MKTALITGASSGIGLEFAKIHASKGGNLILVARNEAKLTVLKTELETKHKVSVYLIVKDLSQVDSAKEVFEETQTNNFKIDYLINNAGFGDYGYFHKRSWEKTNQMIQLNMTTLTHFCHLYASEMIKNKSGKILNIASTAAFQPGPMMAVYFATKAYVLHFSEALSNELKEFGISVTTLCPGPTESGFQGNADMTDSELFNSSKIPSSKEVAIFGYNSMINSKTVVIHGFMNYIMANSSRFVPRSFVLKIVRKLQGKVNQ